MKSIIAFVASTAFSSIALAGDCSSMKMKPTDASAPAASKVADTNKRLQDAAKAESQAPKQQMAQVDAAVKQGTR
jgi:hypothetical protein